VPAYVYGGSTLEIVFSQGVFGNVSLGVKTFCFFLFPTDFPYKSGVAGEVFVGNEKKTNRVCNFWKSSTVLTIKAMQVTVRAIAEFGGYYEKGNLQSNKKIISRPANSRGAESCSLWNLVTKCSRYD